MAFSLDLLADYILHHSFSFSLSISPLVSICESRSFDRGKAENDESWVVLVWFVFLLFVCVWVGDKHTTHAVKNDASYLPPKEQ